MKLGRRMALRPSRPRTDAYRLTLATDSVTGLDRLGGAFGRRPVVVLAAVYSEQ
jgi:hypothetical protein